MIRGLLSQLNQWRKGTPHNHINWLYHTPPWFNRLAYRMGWACHCGSGGHPRRCHKHPWAYRMHVLELNLDAALDEIAALKELDAEMEHP